MNSVLDFNLFGNTVLKYIISIAIFITATKLLYYFKSKILKKIEEISQKTETKFDDFTVDLINRIKWFEYQFIALYIALKPLYLNPKIQIILHWILVIIITYRVVSSLEAIINFWFSQISGNEYAKSLNAIRIFFRIFVWIIAILFLLQNAGINISSLLAGVGIGGVALALASQTILGDIFNFFVIIFDKPFKVGDFISLPQQNISGTIEEIGLKSIRIRTLSGELAFITNSKIMGEIIQNFSFMRERRVLQTIGVIYETPMEKLKLIPQIIKKSVEKVEKTRFDRANLIRFNNYSIDFEFVYYILSADYSLYINLNEQVLCEIARQFQENGIEFAYPTQKLYISKQGG
ncbi:MAG: mechanosensitive ion channel family protein [Elusimicrobiota bacterium]